MKSSDTSIIGKPINISESIALPEVVMLAFWCNVFHQLTENLIIGIFTAPIIATILRIWSAVCLELNDDRRATRPMY